VERSRSEDERLSGKRNRRETEEDGEGENEDVVRMG